MALQKITSVKGTAVYVQGNDIDTDRIIPARFMKCVTFDGLGQYAFYDERMDAKGNKKNHVLNKEPFNKAPIMISGANFGCGSSREHAPQSLYYWGIRAIVAESFAEIFFGNSTTLGIPCVSASSADISAMAKIIESAPLSEVTIDLQKMQISVADKKFPITIAETARYALTNGSWDLIGELADNADEVRAVAKKLAYV